MLITRGKSSQFLKFVRLAIAMALACVLLSSCEDDGGGKVSCPVTLPYVHLSEKALANGSPNPVDVKPFIRCSGTVEKIHIRAVLQAYVNGKWVNIGIGGSREEFNVTANTKVLVMAIGPCLKASYRGGSWAQVTEDGIVSTKDWNYGAVKYNPCNL